MRQCRKYANVGQHYCRFHGRRLKLSSAPRSLYSLRATEKLKQLLERLESAPDDRKSLADEIDVARAFATEAVALADRAVNSTNPDGTPKQIAESVKVTAIKIAQEALTHVALLIEKHAKVTAMSDGTLDATQVRALLDQVVRCVQQRVTSEEEREALLADIEAVNVPRRDASVNVVIS